MANGVVYLSAATDAVDASLGTKAQAVLRFMERAVVSPERIGAIGDSVNDLPFLTIPGLGLRGAPANAQGAVKRVLDTLQNAVILNGTVLDAFAEFFQDARRRGITHIFADRDGVLIWREPTSHDKERLRAIFSEMGTEGMPFVHVLTGSSVAQNLDFISRYGIAEAAAANPCVAADPYVVLAENGAVRVNVLTGATRSDAVDLDLCGVLTGAFRRLVLQQVERQILPAFDLMWSDSHSNQASAIYVPPKQTMVTINIPRSKGDDGDYRRSGEADELRAALLAIMRECAKRLNIRHLVLGSQ